MAKQVRSKLSHNRQERTQEVAETLEQIGQRFQEMQTRLHEALNACREARHEYVERMIQGFDETHQQLAHDLQEASRVWRSAHNGQQVEREHKGRRAAHKHDEQADIA